MASTYLSRTGTTPTNEDKATISFWVKRGALGVYQRIISGQSDVSGRDSIYFLTDDKLYGYLANATVGSWNTSMVFRDTSAWYHIVIAYDTTQATASNRVKVYVNGEEVSISITETIIQNTNLGINNSSFNTIGTDSDGSPSEYFDGSLAHFHLIDGTQYQASDFGETDTATGIWKPKTAPVVTYGTNGFFLKFENSASFGTDSSGNANNFTVNGTMTQTIDTPSNVFATLNPLSRNAGTFANGNTSKTGGNDIASTIGVTTGKWYWEVKRSNSTNSFHTGICSTNKGMNGVSEQFLNGEANSIGGAIYVNEGNTGNTSYSGGAGFSSVTYNSFGAVSISSGDILGFALDLDSATKRLDVYQNGSSIGNVTFSYDELNPIFVYCRMNAGVTADFNFGNGYFGTTTVSSAENPDDGIGIFEFSPPTGYKSLCTKSLNSQEYD